MPIDFVRRLTANQRTPTADRHLGYTLAFVAGAINAGGFLAVRQYTSHMTGIVSAMADSLAIGTYGLVLAGIGALISFVAGATCTALLVNYGRRTGLQSTYALPLLLESALLLLFGIVGAQLSRTMGLFVPMTVVLLCFIMGLQNALVTKVSRAEIRTTHITGVVTDIGIELGRLLYWNRSKSSKSHVVANLDRLRLLGMLATSFFGGGVAGALGFKHVGYAATLPLAVVLVALAIVPPVDDVRFAWGRRRKASAVREAAPFKE
jgi:uncharacterized membrane protein YoaK (UPF0700 family)